jgi:hypothetical protein
VEFLGNGVCVLISTGGGGGFIGPWRSSTDLAKAVTHQVVAGRPSHLVGRPGGMASIIFVHRLALPPVAEKILELFFQEKRLGLKKKYLKR